MTINFKIFLVVLLLGSFAKAQTTDIARLEYTYIPFSKSNNSLSQFRALLQLPIPLDSEKNNILVAGFDYRYIDIDILDAVPFAVDQVSSVQRMDAYLGYVYKVSSNWRLGIKGGVRIASTLNHAASGDDYIYTASVYAINDMTDVGLDKPYRWILGLDYTTTPGRNYPLPLINYYREFRPNWTYTLGVPKTNVRHYLNNDHKDALQGFVTLDNFFANLQTPISVDGRDADNISLTIVLAGLGYEHFFTDHLLYYAYATHSVSNDFRLRTNDRDEVYTINDNNSFYFRTGVKFKF